MEQNLILLPQFSNLHGFFQLNKWEKVQSKGQINFQLQNLNIFLKWVSAHRCTSKLSHPKKFTSLFPLIFLSKLISLYELGRPNWILDIIWPLNHYFNQIDLLKQVWKLNFWDVINCIFVHWTIKLTLSSNLDFSTVPKWKLGSHTKSSTNTYV